MAETAVAFSVILPSVVSWARPRRIRGLTRYPAAYERDRQAWASVVLHAVVEQGWSYPAAARFGVFVRVVNAPGRCDLDRVITAVCDALQSGRAISDDCKIESIQAVRVKRRGEPTTTSVTVDVLVSVGNGYVGH